MTMSRVIPLAMAGAVWLTFPAIGQSLQLAQQMSTDQMINALRPTANTVKSKELRGIGPSHLSGNREAVPPVSTQGTSKGTRVQPPAENRDLASINLNVHFRTNSAQLTPDAMQILDTLGRALSSSTLAPYRFQIVGHTDAPGDAELNKLLSQRRAQAVVDYIATKYGVSRERLDAWGVGPDDPLVVTQRPEVRNRRVQIINVGA